MTVGNNADAFTSNVLGVLVRRPATTLVQNTSTPLFTISTGLVMVTSLFGIVSTAVANTASLTAKLVTTPSGGSVADLCAATGITDDAVGTLYGWTFVDGDELMSQLTEGGTEVPSVNFVPRLQNPAIMRPGTIGVTVSNHDPGTGAVKWYCSYVPLDNGARIARA